jgi:hypothetical protein
MADAEFIAQLADDGLAGGLAGFERPARDGPEAAVLLVAQQHDLVVGVQDDRPCCFPECWCHHLAMISLQVFSARRSPMHSA